MKTSIATVSLSGSLVEKLYACAAAGFDGVEIFEPDLIAAEQSPEEIRALARRLRLSLDLYQPLRDLEGVDEVTFTDNLRRAGATFATAARLGIDTVLVCSNVATATIDDDAVSADQLRRIGDLAAEHGLRIAIPGEKIFFLQLADAPALSMDVLSWSRHHRLFPGEGAFDLADFVGDVLAAGYRGPLSLEVFNDTFRQTDPEPTAVNALRSLRWLQDRLQVAPLADTKPPTAFDFVEIKAEDCADVEALLGRLGFTPGGRHRSKPVTLWTAGDARVVLNEAQARDQRPHVAAIGLHVPQAAATSARAAELMAPPAYRRTLGDEQDFGSAVAPDGTELFWVDDPTAGEPAWTGEFRDGRPRTDSPVTRIDQVNLTQPWQTAEDTVLFLRSVFGLDADAPAEVPGPRGLVRSQVLRTADGAVRIPLNVAPQALDDDALPQHVAFACSDVLALARSARAAGLEFLSVPDNYYDYLRGRFGLDGDFVARLADLDLLYDQGPYPSGGHFVHFYTRTVGSVFFEFVQRFDGYDGYGVDNAPVRLAAQRTGRH